MPTIEVSFSDLQGLVQKSFSLKELEELLEYAKAEIDSCEGETLKIDVKDSNRPDLWSTEGLAREIRSHIGLEKGLCFPKTLPAKKTVFVDRNLARIRPAAAYAVIKNVEMNENVLRQLIQLQEKICLTFGRKRREVAIGIFDLKNIEGNLKYFAEKPDRSFVPLGFSKEMSLKKILSMHPKGREYGFLLKGQKRFPLLEDSKKNVLSMPPIINSETSGKVTGHSTDLFLDVTGFNQKLVEQALEIVCLALSMRGGKIEKVNIVFPDKKIVMPAFNSEKIIVSMDLIEKISGLKLSKKIVKELLLKSHMQAKNHGKDLLVFYPSYRADILHPVDIVEEVLISYGYNSIPVVEPLIHVKGGLEKKTILTEKFREAGISLGFQEVLTYTLTSKEKQLTKTCLKNQVLVEIGNPMSTEWSVFRKNLFPELLEFLSKNSHRVFPQKIFEVGATLVPDKKRVTSVSERISVCFVYSGSNASFNLAKSFFEEFCRLVGLKLVLKPKNISFFEKGRSAVLKSKKCTGFLGEFSLNTLNAFAVKEKTCAFEVCFNDAFFSE